MFADRLGGLVGLVAVVVAGIALYNTRQAQEETHRLLRDAGETLETFKEAYETQQTDLKSVRDEVTAAREEVVRLERDLEQMRASAQPVTRYRTEPKEFVKHARRDKGDIPFVGPEPAKKVEKVIQLGGNIELKIADQRAFLGVMPMAINPAVAKRLGYPNDFGLWVVKVTPNQPAARAGIAENDVMTHFQGIPLKSSELLEKLLNKKRPGEKVEVGLFRKGKQFTVNLELGAKKR